MPSTRLRLVCLLAIAVTAGRIAAQENPLQIEVSGAFQSRTVPEILTLLQEQYPVRFYYYPDQMPVYRRSLQFDRTPLYTALPDILSGTQLTFVRYEGDRVVIIPRIHRERAYAEELIRQWEDGRLTPPVMEAIRVLRRTFGDSTAAPPPGKLVLSGTITDARNGDPVIGAAVGQPGTSFGAITGFDGRYRLELPAGRQQLQVQYIGYQSVQLELGLYAAGRLDLALEVQAFALDEVIVSAEADNRRITSPQIGVQQLSPRTIRELPALLGEADVIRSLTLLPGVSTAGEGASGFNVRGGNIDQNLILQDGMPLYNASHALGFFSLFHTDAVQNVTLYKGHIPAQYGGRAASVLDVDLRPGDARRFRAQGGLGMIASRLLLEGPLLKDRLSFLAGGRLAYPQYLLRRVEDPDVNSSSADFADLTGRLSLRLPGRSSIDLSGFWSTDYFRFSDDFGYEWRNRLLSARWKQIYSPRWSSTLLAGAGDYRTRQFDPEGNDAFNLYGGLRYYRGKGEVAFVPDEDHVLRGGLEWLFQDTSPERIEPGNETATVADREVAKGQGHEVALYLQDEWTVSPRLAVSAGLRYSLFFNVGPGIVYRYADGAPRSDQTLLDSIRHGGGALIRRYGGPEPRLSAKLSLGPSQSLKVSYNRLYQYTQLVSNTTAATPVDVWQLSDTYVPPLAADNYSAGYFLNLGANTWELSAEVYYRRLRDLLEYRDLPELLLNPRLETDLLRARGRAYGLELSVRKRLGAWTGWLSYTYARTQLRTQGAFPETRINNGAWYPANFDQPHQLTLTSRWQLNPKHSFSLNFVYNSGRPVTAPVGGYLLGNTFVPHFSGRNAFRIPDYHRLDIAYTFDNSEGRRKGFRGSFTIAVYNLYARDNAFSVFFRRDDAGIPKAFRLAVLGSAVPAFTYNFMF